MGLAIYYGSLAILLEWGCSVNITPGGDRREQVVFDGQREGYNFGFPRSN